MVRRSQVVMVPNLWLACHCFKPRATEDPLCSGGEVIYVKSVELKILLLVWCGRSEIRCRPHQLTERSLKLLVLSPTPLTLFNITRGLLVTDHVILNHGQVTWTTPQLAPLLLTATPHQGEDVSAHDRFKVHRCPTRRYWARTRNKASHDSIPIPLGYRGQLTKSQKCPLQAAIKGKEKVDRQKCNRGKPQKACVIILCYQSHGRRNGKIGGTGNVIGEIVHLSRQINLEVNGDDVQELLDFHNQELTIDELTEMDEQEPDIEELES
ncbi:uncharacterized protein TNCV_312421 [Trichonephila clavipes]|nr:uncharacterized protein TNCV_312421 [Trichonephila clavipes]